MRIAQRIHRVLLLLRYRIRRGRFPRRPNRESTSRLRQGVPQLVLETPSSGVIAQSSGRREASRAARYLPRSGIINYAAACYLLKRCPPFAESEGQFIWRNGGVTIVVRVDGMRQSFFLLRQSNCPSAFALSG